jgi:hypothetical protein
MHVTVRHAFVSTEYMPVPERYKVKCGTMYRLHDTKGDKGMAATKTLFFIYAV